MLFNSYIFIFAFLPLVAAVFFLCGQLFPAWVGKSWLLLSSWFFYGWWNPAYLPLLWASTAGNFLLSRKISSYGKGSVASKRFMVLAVVANVAALGYYKYMDFFIANANRLGFDFPLLHLALPLAISFFTLQQIAYIVDTYRGGATNRKLLDYSLFVCFFPQLIAGPIVHHKEIIPQLNLPRQAFINWENIGCGLYLFSIGLFKKVALADTFAQWASNGFDRVASPSLLEAWISSYSYTLQLYFDFSAYSDMALGLALMFNIKLPQNFNSPYAATSIINLWQRWHMTLTRFINTYIYKPVLRAMPAVNFRYGMMTSFLAMVIAGIWHGAAWTFLVFGVLQGIAIVVNHIWRRSGYSMPGWLGWLVTFHFFSFSLVIFRALEWQDVEKIYQGMLGLSGLEVGNIVATLYQKQPFWYFSAFGAVVGKNLVALITCLGMIAYGIFHVSYLPNSNTLADRLTFTWRQILGVSCMLTISIAMLSNPSEFIYFQF